MPVVALRSITFETVRSIIALRVGEQQEPYVAPNGTSIAEGLLNPGGWLRAITADDAPVGFVLLFDPTLPGAIARHPPVASDCRMLWRFMIAHEHQKRGYARQTLDLVCDHVRRDGAQFLLTSFVPGPHGPEPFYLRYGFAATGVLRGNGREPELRLGL